VFDFLIPIGAIARDSEKLTTGTHGNIEAVLRYVGRDRNRDYGKTPMQTFIDTLPAHPRLTKNVTSSSNFYSL
jgi:hypothetical protein